MNSQSQRAYLACDKGAVMIAGIFMTLLLVAMLYAVIGIGRTVVMREGMQDAADAAAFSAAIFHARGMNLIVFINLLMAMLIAVLVAIRLAQTLLVMLAFAATAAAFFSFGSTLPIAAAATEGAVTLQNTFKAAKRAIFPMLQGLHQTQKAVSVTVPFVAMADGMIEAASHHPAAKGAFALPGALSLPVEPDEFSVLCGKGAGMAAGLATELAFFGPIPSAGPPDWLLDPIEDLAEELGKSTSKFLCGDGSGSPPKHTQTEKYQLPKPEGLEHCEADPKSSKCAEAERNAQRAIPQRNTGKCQQSCSYDGPYERRARQARRECEPKNGRKFTSFTWQEQSVKAVFQNIDGSWVETSRTTSQQRIFTKVRAPCGVGGSLSPDQWELSSGPQDASAPIALCSDLDLRNSGGAPMGKTRQEIFKEVARIFSCTKEVSQEVPLANKEDALGGPESKSRSPHRVDNDADLGGEAFQIRAIAFGESPGPGEARKGVQLADRRHAISKEGESDSSDSNNGDSEPESDDETDSDLYLLAGELGSVSVAQAEYYFAHQGDAKKADWMWDMFWTARLKHFRLPSKKARKKEKARRRKNAASSRNKASEFGTPSASGNGQNGCKASGAKDCQKKNSAFDAFDGILRH